MQSLLLDLRDVVAGFGLSPAAVVGGTFAIFAAALLRGFTGFGFALAAVPLLSFIIAPSLAVLAALGLQFLGGLFDIRRAARECHWPSLHWMILGATFGSPLGMLILSNISAPVARIAIGSITMIAVVVLGRGFTFAEMPRRVFAIAMGALAGLFNGVAAMPGPPAVAFYMSAPLSRPAARASLLVFFTATSIVALISAVAVGLIDARAAVLSLAGLPVMILGTRVGEKAFVRSSAAIHRRVSVASLAAIAIGSIAKGLSELL